MTPSTRQQTTGRLAAGRAAATACQSAKPRTSIDQQDSGGMGCQEADSGNNCGDRELKGNDVHSKNATANPSPARKGHRGPHGSSSSHRGVTQHKRTKKWEAHLWDDRHQVYLGGFDKEEDAARAHDVMAVKCRGMKSITNYNHTDYKDLLPQLEKLSKDDVRHLLMRKASTFARGKSQYRGVTKHKVAPRNTTPALSKASLTSLSGPSCTPNYPNSTPKRIQSGKWEARLSQTKTRKQSYIGLFDTEEEAAKAYDTASMDNFGAGVATNFDLTRYGVDSEPCLDSLGVDDDFDSAVSDIDRLSASPLLEPSSVTNQLSSGLLDFLPTFAYPKQTLGSFPSPPQDPFSTPFSALNSLDPTTHMHPSNLTLTSLMSSPNLHQSPHKGSPELPTIPTTNDITIPLSRPDRAFKWRQIQAPPGAHSNPGQTSSDLQRAAVNSACITSGTTWSATHSTGSDSAADMQSPQRMYMNELRSTKAVDPARVVTGMQRVLAKCNPVSGPDELQHRLESCDTPIMKYTDWFRQGNSAAATAAPDEADCMVERLCRPPKSSGFGDYGRAGAEGPWLPKKCLGHFPVLPPAEQPVSGMSYTTGWAADLGSASDCPHSASSGFRGCVGIQQPNISNPTSAQPWLNSRAGIQGAAPCIVSLRKPLFMADFETTDKTSFASWDHNVQDDSAPCDGKPNPGRSGCND